jgi:hypothetical protein
MSDAAGQAMPSARAIARALRPLSRAGFDTAGLAKRTVDPMAALVLSSEWFSQTLLREPPLRRQWLPAAPNPSNAAVRDRRLKWFSVLRARSENPSREFVAHLMALWRRVDPGGFARAMAQLRAGRIWVDFRPARPPGRLLAASGRLTRGPDCSRMTSALVVRGEP